MINYSQEMCDHYMAPPNQAALDCMKEIQVRRDPRLT